MTTPQRHIQINGVVRCMQYGREGECLACETRLTTAPRCGIAF